MKILSLFAGFVLVAVSGAQQHDVKGQSQLAGGTAQFGTVYSLKNGFNFEIMDGRYTLEPYNAYYPLTADADKKIVVIDMAVKNATASDNFFNADSFMTLVDDHGQLYPAGSLRLNSLGGKDASITLKPGQGIGQPDLKDPFSLGFAVPADAKITKIIVNVGRLNGSEDVVRYMLVQPPADIVHTAGINFIAPLPDSVRDFSDPYGAVAIPVGKGAVGAYVPSGAFELKLVSLPQDFIGQVGGNDPDEGKKFVYATFTAKSMMDGDQSFFTVSGSGDPSYSLVDTDGETYKASNFFKAVANEDADHSFKQGDEYTYRVIFQVPTAAKLKQIVYSTGGSRQWAVDIP